MSVFSSLDTPYILPQVITYYKRPNNQDRIFFALIADRTDYNIQNIVQSLDLGLRRRGTSRRKYTPTQISIQQTTGRFERNATYTSDKIKYAAPRSLTSPVWSFPRTAQ